MEIVAVTVLRPPTGLGIFVRIMVSDRNKPYATVVNRNLRNLIAIPIVVR